MLQVPVAGTVNETDVPVPVDLVSEKLFGPVTVTLAFASVVTEIVAEKYSSVIDGHSFATSYVTEVLELDLLPSVT